MGVYLNDKELELTDNELLNRIRSIRSEAEIISNVEQISGNVNTLMSNLKDIETNGYWHTSAIKSAKVTLQTVYRLESILSEVKELLFQQIELEDTYSKQFSKECRTR